MITENLARAFVNAAKALSSGKKDTGFFSTGVKKLDFRAQDESGEKKIFTAIEQNPNTLSTPGAQARMGKKIVQIRDNSIGGLLGNVDVEEERFNSYERIPQPIDIEDVEKALGGEVVTGEVPITATRTSPPAGQAIPEGGRGQGAAQLGAPRSEAQGQPLEDFTPRDNQQHQTSAKEFFGENKKAA